MEGESLPKGERMRYNRHVIGAWHSPVVRTVRVREVAGSNPAAPTISNLRKHGS